MPKNAVTNALTSGTTSATRSPGWYPAALRPRRRLRGTHPQWLNLPGKGDWLKLAVDARLRALKPAEGLLLGLAVFMNLTFISFTLDTFAVATAARASLSTAKLVLVIACMLVWLVLSIIRIRQAIGDEVRLARQAAAGDVNG